MSTDDVVVRARQALASVPDGPWTVRSDYRPDLQETTYCIEDLERFRGYRNTVFFGEDRELAEFIAGAPGLIAELAAEVERLRDRG